MRPQLRIHQRAEHEVIAQLGAVVIRVIDGVETSIAGMRELFEVADQVQRQYPIVGMLIVVEHGTPVPDGDVRRCIDGHLMQYADGLVTGYALMGLGFWAEEARAFANDRAGLEGCTILVDISLEQLTERMARELVGIDAQQLIEACELLRASLT